MLENSAMRGDIYSRLCLRRSTDDRFCDLVETHRVSNANLKSSLATLLSFSTTAPLLHNTLLKRLGVTPGLQLEGTQYSQTNIHLCIFPLPLQNFKYKGSLLLCSVLRARHCKFFVTQYRVWRCVRRCVMNEIL